MSLSSRLSILRCLTAASVAEFTLRRQDEQNSYSSSFEAREIWLNCHPSFREVPSGTRKAITA